MFTLFVVLAAGYFTLVLFDGIGHRPIRVLRNKTVAVERHEADREENQEQTSLCCWGSCGLTSSGRHESENNAG